MHVEAYNNKNRTLQSRAHTFALHLAQVLDLLLRLALILKQRRHALLEQLDLLAQILILVARVGHRLHVLGARQQLCARDVDTHTGEYIPGVVRLKERH